MNKQLEALAMWINRHEGGYAEVQEDCVLIVTEYSFHASNGGSCYGEQYHHVRTLAEARAILGY